MTATWVMEEMATASLPDKRLDKRLREVLGQLAKLDPLPAKVLERHPLRADPRLHVRVPVRDKAPKFAERVKRLRQATKLELTYDTTLTHHDPDYGLLSLGTPRSGP